MASLTSKRGPVRTAITKAITRLHELDHDGDMQDDEKIHKMSLVLVSL